MKLITIHMKSELVIFISTVCLLKVKQLKRFYLSCLQIKNYPDPSIVVYILPNEKKNILFEKTAYLQPQKLFVNGNPKF